MTSPRSSCSTERCDDAIAQKGHAGGNFRRAARPARSPHRRRGDQFGSQHGTQGHTGRYRLRVAPYVDMTNNQEPMLNAAISSGGLKAFTAAFVIGSGCTPIWGDTLPVTNDPTVSGDISSAQSAGAQVIVSFGGAGGVELAQSCTNTTSLQAAYQTVINQYHLSHVDFDIEGAA